MIDNGISPPAGSVADITKTRSVMSHRYREEHPQINQVFQDTLPGKGSGDQ